MANDVKRMDTAPKRWSARLTLLLCLGVLGVLLTQVPDPAHIIDTLTGAPAAVGVLGSLATIQSMLLATAGLIAWLLVAWAVAVLIIGLAARLPGRGGRRARRLLPRIAPAAIGRLVATAVGVSIIAGTAACAAPAGAGPVGAEPSGTAGSSSTTMPTLTSTPDTGGTDGSITIDWPDPTTTAPTTTAPTTTASTTTAPTTTAPTAPASTTATPAATSAPTPVTPTRPTPASPPAESAVPGSPEPAPTEPAPPPESLTVQPGDSLWRIAAHTLGPDATDADIDNAWRAWYFTNREVIGDDPDVIVPGQALVAPATAAAARS